MVSYPLSAEKLSFAPVLAAGLKDPSAVQFKWMINTSDQPGEAMKDMAAVKPRQVAYIVAPEAKGDQALEPGIENGVKVFDVEASIVRWNILSNVAVEAYAYNRQVPGPRLQLTEGDHVRSASAMRFRKARRSTGTD
jgi:hypothetical protein